MQVAVHAVVTDPDAETKAGHAGALCAHPEEIEADFRHHYHGLDLRDLWRPGGGTSRMTWRMFGVLLDRLPPESAYRTAVTNDIGAASLAALTLRQTDTRFGGWSHEAHLLATIADRLAGLDVSMWRVRGAKNIPPPERIPRPGVAPAVADAMSARQRADMERHRAQINQAHQMQRARAQGGGSWPQTTEITGPAPSP